MSGLNDLLLPVVDRNDEVWATFFNPEEVTALMELIEELQQPMLGLGAIYPFDVDERPSIALRVVAESEDVSCFLLSCYCFCLFVTLFIICLCGSECRVFS